MAVARKQNASSDMTEAMAASHPSGAHDPSQHHHDHAHSDGDATSETQDRVRDPVCGMTVDPHTTPHRAEHRGRTYYFCSAGCRAKFAGRSRKISRTCDERSRRTGARGHDLHLPDAPADPPGRARDPARSAAWRSSPMLATARRRPNPELVDMTPALLDRPRPDACRSFALEMGGHLIDLHHAARPADCRTGCSSCWRRRSCCGPAGRSSCAAGNRSSRAASTCSP